MSAIDITGLNLWMEEPEEHDYPAAEEYLSLILPPKVAKATVDKMRKAPIAHRKAKDIIRASRLELLPMSNEHVRGNIIKVVSGRKLSPVLLVRGDARAGVPLQIADGYHRVCASYHLDENTPVPCRLVKIARAAREAS